MAGMSLSTDMDKLLLPVLTCILLMQNVHASWWYLGMTSSAYQSTLQSPKLNYRSKCSMIDVLAPKQRELCNRSKNVLDIVSKGASMGIDECQYQFSDRRWNCSTVNNTSVFGNVLRRKSREKAYIYAISSAGVMHAVTKACAKGELNICSCDKNIRSISTDGEFMWGGCSHNVKFGEKFTKEFVDSKENSEVETGLMNLWNNGAGRKLIHNNMRLLCKCHGVSGSCSVRICWRTMAPFREIGHFLKDRFDGASLMKVSRKRQKLKPQDRRQKKPEKSDLVYLEESPDYCNYNLDSGSLGTSGRKCNRTSYGLDGCALMCCGRGYNTRIAEVTEDCNCKFFWCCRVECEKCTRVVEEHYCN